MAELAPPVARARDRRPSPVGPGGSAGRPAAPDRRIGNYRLVERLGEGGMGEVFVAVDETLGRRVALKTVRAAHRLDPRTRARFLREAQLLSKLDHPNVCRVHGYVEGEPEDCLVLELIEGRELTELIEEGVGRSVALEIAEQLMEALAAAHAAGVVHRDLKPANVMWTDEGRVVVLDFGLAQFVAAGGRSDGDPAPGPAPERARPCQTEAEAVVGTLEYMSPEQTRAEPVTAASDLFALGLILQELLTGEPGREANPSDLEFVQEVAAGGSRPVGGLPADLTELLERLKARAPTERPTALEALERLRWIRGKPARSLRRAAAAAALLVALLAGLKYTLDLRAANAATDRRRAQAEAALTFMLGSFWEKVSATGRLEDLEEVAEQAFDYFTAVPEEELSAEELGARSTLFHRVGEVRRNGGDQAGALEAFRRSHDLARRLHERDPADDARLYELGQAQHYMGLIPYLDGDPEGALGWWQRYLDTSRELVARRPDSEDYRVELAYAQVNAGVVLLELDCVDRAARRFEDVVATWRDLLGRDPARADLQFELAGALSWLGDARSRAGDSAGAIASFGEEGELWSRLAAGAPADNTLRYQMALVQLRLGRERLRRGETGAGLVAAREVKRLAAELFAADPANAEWARALALGERLHGLLQRAADLPAARASFLTSAELLRELHAGDPDSVDGRLQLARARALLGETHLALGDRAAAAAACGEALTLLGDSGAGAGGSDWVARVYRAHAQLLRGRLEEGRPEAATRAREAALATLAPVIGETRDPEYLDPWVRALIALGRLDEARGPATALRAAGYAEPTFVAELVASGLEGAPPPLQACAEPRSLD